MPRYTYAHIHHTHLYNWSTQSCYSTTAAFNDCYNKLTACAVWLTLIGLASMICINTKPCPLMILTTVAIYVTAVELV